MSARVIQVSNNFWNIRGSFKIAGLLDIGTHASLVRRKNGKFIFLDSYTLEGDTGKEIDEITDGGEAVEAVLNLHPFHTVHVKWMHQRYPAARHYGSARHIEKFPELDWEELQTEEEALHKKFASNLDFSVPAGVDFISDDENIHFSSVLAYHRSSRTIHVDDTLMYIRLPRLLSFFGLTDALSFHPTLAKVLERRAGAADEFHQWAVDLANNWCKAENLCAAHTASLLSAREDPDKISDRILNALDKVQPTLDRHRQKYG